MAIVFIVLNAFLICFLVSLNVVSNGSIDGVWVVPLAPAVMTMRRLTFQPRATIESSNGWYLLVLFVMVSCGNLSLQYVNSMYWIAMLSFGCCGGVPWCGRPITHSKSGLNLALHWHRRVSQVQGRSQLGTVLSGGALRCFPAFISV